MGIVILYTPYIVHWEAGRVNYLVTWVEGDEVVYRFVPADELPEVLETDKHYIVIPLH
jgi:hypothetical protein